MRALLFPERPFPWADGREAGREEKKEEREEAPYSPEVVSSESKIRLTARRGGRSRVFYLKAGKSPPPGRAGGR